MTSKDFEIKSIESTVLHVPFHPRCAKVKEVRVPFWSLVDVVEVTLSCGVKGIGETLTRYTWGQSGESQFERVKGKNLFDFLWDDGLGAGLQMALFDAAGKAMGVPCHRLMGLQYRDACPVSWWTQDRIPAEWAAEAKAAEEHGFTSMKVKARPWFDPEKQMAAVCEVVSPHFNSVI